MLAGPADEVLMSIEGNMLCFSLALHFYAFYANNNWLYLESLVAALIPSYNYNPALNWWEIRLLINYIIP